MSLGRSVRAGEAYVQLSLRDQLTKGLNQASRRLQSFGAGAAKIGAGVMGAGLAGGAMLLPTIKAASEMQETMGKFNVVFGEQSEATKAWADSFAEEVGRSKQQIASFMAGSQDLFVPLGIEPGAANALSKQLTGLAVDLASFNNMADEDVLANLQSALTGSGSVMKKYGVILNEAATQQELLNMGMDPRTASEAAKVQARMNIIMAGTTAAHGDAVRTGDSYANQMKRLQATLADLKVTIGAELLPVATDAVAWMVRSAKSAGDWISQNRALIPIIGKGIVIVAAAGAGLVVFGGAAMVAGKAVAAMAAISGAGFALMGASAGALTSPMLILAGVLGAGAVLWAEWSYAGQGSMRKLTDGLLDFKDIGLETFEGVREALADGDLAGAAEIALAGLGAAWNEGLAKLMGNWGNFVNGLVETFAGAVQEIANLWLGTQGQIANAIISMAQQEGVVGDLMAKVLGVDMREEQRRQEQLTAQLNPVRRRNLEHGIETLESVQERLQAGDIEGARAINEGLVTGDVDADLKEIARGLNNLRQELGQPLKADDLFAQARRQIDQQTQDSQRSVEDRVGQFMAGYAEFADPDRLRAEADARRQQIADMREQRRLAREQQREREEQETPEIDSAQTVAEGIAVAQGVASAGTFSAWAIEGMFGRSREEEQLEEARQSNRHLDGIGRQLRRGGVVLVN